MFNEKEWRKQYRQKHREIILERQRRCRNKNPNYKIVSNNWAKNNPDKVKLKCRRYREKSFRNFIKRAMNVARLYDQKYKREFNIDLPYLLELLELQEYCCALSGIKLTHQLHDLRAVSIDRIDSSIGHIKGNVQLTCQLFNMGKGNKTNVMVHSIIQEIELNLLRKLKEQGQGYLKLEEKHA